MTKLFGFARPIALAAAALLTGCAHNVPLESNVGYVWTEVISACRGLDHPTNECVHKDFVRAIAMVEYANPGRDESTYMAIINTVSTLTGTAIGYLTAGVTGAPLTKSLEIVGGEVGGSGVGTALSYNTVLFRSSVEALMYSFGRDKKLNEEYMGLVAYTGKTEHWDEIVAKVDAQLKH